MLESLKQQYHPEIERALHAAKASKDCTLMEAAISDALLVEFKAELLNDVTAHFNRLRVEQARSKLRTRLIDAIRLKNAEGLASVLAAASSIGFLSEEVVGLAQNVLRLLREKVKLLEARDEDGLERNRQLLNESSSKALQVLTVACMHFRDSHVFRA